MKLRQLGYYVTMDDNGRLTIPRPVRDRLKFDPGEEYEVYSFGSWIGFKKKRPLFELIDLMEEAVDMIGKDRSITKSKREEIRLAFENLKLLIQGVAYRK